ncbi:MAG TPA: hybrid sensor histidine kinase/response regulator, partial [Vicinamibacteria bacterium]|nr:hybrid sensor histidine kinase/response regulator [Vicinamibacteria bacterium]
MRANAVHARFRLRSSVVALVALSLLPAVIFSGFVVRALWRQQVEEVGEALRQASAALAVAVDREIGSSIRTLRAIADAPDLTSRSLPEIHAQHQRLLVSQPAWAAIILMSPQGLQLSDTRVPLGTPLRHGADESHIARVMALRAPAVSDVFTDLSREPVVEVAVPVLRDERLVYILAACLRLNRFADVLLTAGGGRGGGAAGILDSRLRFVARSRDQERHVGGSPTPEFSALLGKAPAGFARQVTLEGDPVYTSWMPTSGGWRVAIGVPAEPMDSALRRSLLWVLLAGLVAFGLSLGAVLVWSGRLSGAIGRSVQAAERLGLGGETPPPLAGSRIQEIYALQAAHATVDARLREERHQREKAEADRIRLLAIAEVARAEAERTNRAKDEFLAMLGHELRNPLAAIANAAAVLDQTSPPDDRGAGVRLIMRRQIGHLTRIVDDLLDVARMTTGQIHLDCRPLDLAEAVERSLVGLAAQLRGRTVARDVQPAWVEADETRLEQIVSNLVTNALKYTPPDRRITIVVRREGSEAMLRVSDEGHGIPPALLPHVFDLFVQGQRTADRRLGGLGLGLTLVRRLVELHGGRIEASSDGPGRGSTFTVWLAACAAPPVDEATGYPPRASCPRRVLIVEDNADARAVLKLLLEGAGHEVHEASDGPSGLEAARRLDVDVALVDLGLPGLDGYEVARQVRAVGRPLRLIAVSGYSSDEHRAKAGAAGFDAFLAKPVTAEALAEA